MTSKIHSNPQDLGSHLLWKKVIAFILVAAATIIVLNDAYKIKNGWMHPETAVWSAKYLMDDVYEKIGFSFNLEEFKKYFGGSNTLISG